MSSLYLYQTIHVNRGQARYVEGHVRALNQASTLLFARPFTTDIEQLKADIGRLVREKRYGDLVSSFVRLEVDATGGMRLKALGTSLYDGYALRSLRPNAASMVYSMPLGDLPTSAREVANLQAREMARRLKSHVAMRCDEEGLCRSLDGNPFAVIQDSVVILPEASFSVERQLIIESARHIGLEVLEANILREDLKTFDEIFWMDYRGITSLKHIDRHPLRGYLTEKIASALEHPFLEIKKSED